MFEEDWKKMNSNEQNVPLVELCTLYLLACQVEVPKPIQVPVVVVSLVH